MPAPDQDRFVTALRRSLRDVPVHGGDGADPGPWNVADPDRPLARAECATAGEVALALRAAADHGVPVAVCAGRHGVNGGTGRSGHLLLDLRRMDRVAPTAGRVRLGGGTKIHALLAGLPDDVVTVTGANPDVGVTGLALGGGYGLLNGRYGMACDMIEAAELVLADGRTVVASAESEPDLYWALRGGGTGFGVVTELTLATRTLPRVLAARLAVPLDGARDALLAVQDALDAEPDLAGILPLFTADPAGAPTLFLSVMWSGAREAGDRFLDGLAGAAGARTLDRRWAPYRDTFEPGDIWPPGRHYCGRTGTIARIDAAVAARVVQAAGSMPAGHTILFLHDLHGAATRVAGDATAFPLRRPHFVAVTVGSWEAGDADAADRQSAWATRAFDGLAPAMIPGGYVNFLHPRETDRVRAFYGAFAERLRAVKRRVDPHGVFAGGTGRLD